MICPELMGLGEMLLENTLSIKTTKVSRGKQGPKDGNCYRKKPVVKFRVQQCLAGIQRMVVIHTLKGITIVS